MKPPNQGPAEHRHGCGRVSGQRMVVGQGGLLQGRFRHRLIRYGQRHRDRRDPVRGVASRCVPFEFAIHVGDRRIDGNAGVGERQHTVGDGAGVKGSIPVPREVTPEHVAAVESGILDETLGEAEGELERPADAVTGRQAEQGSGDPVLEFGLLRAVFDHVLRPVGLDPVYTPAGRSQSDPVGARLPKRQLALGQDRTNRIGTKRRTGSLGEPPTGT
jgi:hypothetical protein